MSRRVRISIFMPAVGLLGFLLAWALVGIPDFGNYRGPYGYILDRVVVPERHMTNVVTAVVFDYRGFDTLGEEFILFTAVTGVVILLREGEVAEKAAKVSRSPGVPSLRLFGTLMVGAGLLVGAWLAAFGYVTPGGGFQGGVVMASGVVLLYFATRYGVYQPYGREDFLDPIEAVGAGGYAVIGVVALLSGLPYLTNLLGPGTPGTLVSAGSIPFLNWASALEVAAANLVLFSEFLQEYIA
jgi:multicomponent Na+:H+ antiporter subunit B